MTIVVSVTTQLKLLASDGKRYLSDMLDYNGIIALGKEFPGKKANRFIEWFTYSDESIDGKSKTKAYESRITYKNYFGTPANWC